MPSKYIFEPWTAPISVQNQAKCVVGTDYPKRIVDHSVVLKENLAKMKAAYAEGQKGKVNSESYYGVFAEEFIDSWPKEDAFKKRKI